jgi:glucose/arabinose dehydrogenase
VSGKISLRQSVKLDHACFGLACHGDTLYVSSKNTIYKYDKDCKQKQVIYHYPLKFYTFSFAVSDDGERLYFSTNTGLTTIDCKGNHISSQPDGNTLRDICIAGEGMVLVLDAKNNVHQLDYNGNRKHGTVNKMLLSTSDFCSMSFDKERCRLILGVIEDTLRVYKCELLSQVS